MVRSRYAFGDNPCVHQQVLRGTPPRRAPESARQRLTSSPRPRSLASTISGRGLPRPRPELLTTVENPAGRDGVVPAIDATQAKSVEVVLSSSRRVKKGPGRRPQSAKRQQFLKLLAQGWTAAAASPASGGPAMPW